MGGDRRVRRHRPAAVRPRPVDGDHGPRPPRRARPHRARRTRCAGCSTAALDPEPARRPTLDEIRHCARPRPGPADAGAEPGRRRSRGPVHHAAGDRRPGRACCRGSTPTRHRGAPDRGRAGPRRDARPAARSTSCPRPHERQDFWDDDWHDHRHLSPQGWVGPPPAVARLRRRARTAGPAARGGRGDPGAAVAAYPYLAAAVVLLLAWLLRSGSMTASAPATGSGCAARPSGTTPSSRRSPRPGTWCASIPTTFLLCVWAAASRVAAALLCYAFSVSLEITCSSAVSPWPPRSTSVPAAPACVGRCRGWSSRSAAAPRHLGPGARGRPARGGRARRWSPRPASTGCAGRRIDPDPETRARVAGRPWHDGYVQHSDIIIT